MTLSGIHADPQPGTRVGGWEVVRLLGRGGMAVVFEVGRVGTGERRALKLMTGGGPAGEVERRFRREFRAHARLHHPNICRVEDGGVWGERPYYIMELVEGHDLRVEVEGWATLPGMERWEKVRSILIQVARALEYVHLRGLVHRDITPSNIMVLPDGSARLMDFGVVKERESPNSVDATAHGEVLGTIAWIAPEQINGEPVDARTDLYALGAVLYLMLTGKRPFNARTIAGYLDRHLHHAPRPPREFVPSVPRALEDICLRLLQKDPAARFASATHVLQVLEGGTAPSGDDAHWPPGLTGRTDEFAAIGEAVGALAEGTGGVLFLSGAAGLGKSRLLDLAAELAVTASVPVYRVAGAPGSAPLGPFRAFAEAFPREQVPSVLRQLYQLDGTTTAVLERYTVFAAFRELCITAGRFVFLVDDLQWADAGSLDLLEYLLRNTRVLGKEPILWVLARTSGVQDARVEGFADGTRTGVAPTVLALHPLDPAAVEELLLSLVADGPAVGPLARRLCREAEGIPALVGEMLRGLADAGVIDIHGARLVLDEADAARIPIPVPRSVRERILERMAPLAEAARTLAEVLAVADQELTLGFLAEATGLDDAIVGTGLEALLAAGVARERRGEVEEHFVLAQSQTRQILYSELAVDRRAGLHRTVGFALERAARRRIHLIAEALAWHFEQGGVPGKAYPYLVRAGRGLLQRSFAAEARDCFDRAVAIEPDAREALTLDDADALLAELLLLRAEANEHLGIWTTVERDLLRVVAIARELGDARLESRAAAALGTRARRGDDLVAAERWQTDALRLAEAAGDASLKVMPLQGLGASRWGQGDLEGARRLWTELLAVGDATGDDRSLGYGANGLGLIALCRGQAAEARRYFEQSAGVFEKLGLQSPLAMARVNLCEIHHLTGNLRRGLELAERTCALARETNHPLGLARGRCYRALLLVDLGRALEALEESEAAIDLVRTLGDREEEQAAMVSATRAAWALGDLEGVRGYLDALDALGVRHDAEGFHPLLQAWRGRLAAMAGDRSAALEHIRAAEAPASNRWAYQECRIDLALARAYAQLGERPLALARTESALRRSEAGGFRFYALKAHALAATVSDEDAGVARHRRVASALARSLAANLPRDDAERFLETHGVAPDASA